MSAPAASASLSARAHAAREQLDAQVRDVVRDIANEDNFDSATAPQDD